MQKFCLRNQVFNRSGDIFSPDSREKRRRRSYDCNLPIFSGKRSAAGLNGSAGKEFRVEFEPSDLSNPPAHPLQTSRQIQVTRSVVLPISLDQATHRNNFLNPAGISCFDCFYKHIDRFLLRVMDKATGINDEQIGIHPCWIDSKLMTPGYQLSHQGF